MAEFLTRHGIVHHLHRIIEDAEKELVLISPYIKADETTKELLKETKRSTKIHVVYGKEKLRSKEEGFLKDLSIDTTFRENLHAKCYLNENKALLTSMNLYEFSQENNDEMGILVSREEDKDLYEAIHRQAMRYIGSSGTTESDRGRPAAKTARKNKDKPKTSKAGFCIRCKADLPVMPTYPYCNRCYTNWKRYENKTYEEKHCHTCGKEHKATLLKPLCSPCYNKYKDVLEFAVN